MCTKICIRKTVLYICLWYESKISFIIKSSKYSLKIQIKLFTLFKKLFLTIRLETLNKNLKNLSSSIQFILDLLQT